MALEHLKGLILILAVLWIIWFFIIGPSTNTNDDTLFINPPGQTIDEDLSN